MALDEQAEQRLYDALEGVMRIPRPKERERILKQAMAVILVTMGWPAVSLERTEDNGKDTTG